MRTLITFLAIIMTTFALAVAQDSTKATESATMQQTAPMADVTAEIKVCTSVEERNPVGEGTSFPANVGTVYVWTRIKGVQGETTIKHVYTHNGVERAVVPLTVKSANWRTWSSKQILDSWTGDWTVEVKDDADNVIGSTTFTITPTTETAPAPTKPDSGGN